MNKTIRRMLCMMIAVLLTLTLAACGKEPAESSEHAKKPEQVDPEKLRPTQPDEPTQPDQPAQSEPGPGEIRLGDVSFAIDDVKSITLQTDLSGTTVELGERERGKFLDMLREVRLQEQDDSFSELDGQNRVYTVELQAGREHTFSFIRSGEIIVVVDGVGYRSDCDAASALTEFADALLNG